MLTARTSEIASQPLPSFVSTCLDDTAALMTRLHPPARLTVLRNPRRFMARLASVSVEECRYTLVSYGTAVRMERTIEADQDGDSIILCLKGSCELEMDGETRQLSAGQGLAGRPRVGLRGEFSDDCERLIIRTGRREKLAGRSGGIAGMYSGQVYLQACADLVTAAIRSPALLACVSRDASVAHPMSQLIEQLLAKALAAGDEQHSSGLPVPRSVLRAERLMRERAAEPLTLADLAAAARVSERALQTHFQRYRQCSPMRYLRDVRLEMARKLLTQSDDPRVDAVALRCGFGHLGRFAAEYRERFGEGPSETKARARSPLAS
jgi:AraC-like DNA-binding protein